MAQDFPSIAHAADLLKAMQASAPSESAEPSETVLALLDRLEQTDPNSPEISEDDTNSSWGHYQYTAGSLTCRSVLTSWAAIGKVDIACRFVAAGIRVCKVARHICFVRNVDPPPSSYLGDAYLDSLIELLWDLWTQRAKSVSDQCTIF